MKVTRRTFLQTASLAAASTSLPLRAARAHPYASWLYVPSAERRGEPELQRLAANAVEAATQAGATYADARLTLTRRQRPGSFEGEERGFGVRVLVNGYWGFLASAVWTPDEAARLARVAVAQARAHSRGKTRPVDLGTIPAVSQGEWVMPVKYDPFDIPIGEKLDVMAAFAELVNNARFGLWTDQEMQFRRQRTVFASSEGSSWTQTTYTSDARFVVFYHDSYYATLGTGAAAADFLSPAGRGWEHIAESAIPQAIPQLIEEAELSRHRVPVDVGRYDMVLGAEAMAALVDETLGAATELDRALGYEANAGGTSYLGDPLAMLGTQHIGSELVTVTGNRSLPGGVATVRWDDEGVVPEEFALVRNGVLVGYQTSREQAAWLAPYYRRLGLPVRSHGCAAAPSALSLQMQHAPNLALAPGKSSASFAELVAGTEKGIAVLDLDVSMDQQCLNGMGSGTMREIVRGKLGRYIRGGSLVFRAPELWKNLVALGGPDTVRWYGRTRSKGQPSQRTTHSVGAVPAKITQLALIDATRKA